MKRPALLNHFLAVTLALPVGAAILYSGAAMAQIEEVVVTARAREESLQDVPASITAFTETDIENMGVRRAEDFVFQTPGVSLVNTVEVGDTQLSIRGLNGARDAETNFAFILDGVLYTNPSAFNREYIDLAQIEVLKGPQGALYGRSAAAGAVIVTTKRPTEETEMELRFGAAEHETYTAAGTIAGALGENLFGRFSFDYRETEGFLFNTFLNDEVVNDFENYSINGRLIWEPSDRTTVDMKIRHAEVDAASIAFNAAFAIPLFAELFGIPDFYIDVNDHEFVFTPNVDPANEQETTEISVKIDHEMDWGTLTAWGLYSDQDQYFLADGTSGAFGFYYPQQSCVDSLVATFGFPMQSPTFNFYGVVPDAPFSTVLLPPYSPSTCDGYQYQERNQEDKSFQIQFTSPADQRLRWQAGAYFLDLDRRVGVAQLLDDGRPDSSLPRSFVNPLTDALVLDDFDTEVWALFGSINYDITESVELSFALRYDKEDRKVTNAVPTPSEQLSTRINYCAATGPGFCSLNGAPLAGSPLNPAFVTDFATGTVVDTLASRSKSFSHTQPKISLTWDATDNLTLFGSWGIGFKSGGFNNLGANETIQFFMIDFAAAGGFPLDLVAPPEIFEEETSSAWELGARWSTLDDRLQLTGAIFATDVDDMQFFEFFVGPFGLLRVVENIDEVSIEGFELGLTWQILDSLMLTGGYSKIDGEIDKFTIRPNTVGNEVPNAPEYTFNAALQYIGNLTSDWRFTGRLEYAYQGATWYNTIQDESTPAIYFGGPPAVHDRSEVDGYGITNLRVGVESDRWRFTAFAQNLTDEEYLAEVITAAEFGGSFIHPGLERTVGFEVSLSY